MGYNTKYDLRVEPTLLVTRKEIKGVDSEGNPASVFVEEKMYDSEIIDHFIKSMSYNPFNDSCKWYQHEETLRKFSKIYPNAVFVLDGVGEQYPDIWRKYFKNGKMQSVIAKIIFEPFNDAALQ